MVSPNPNRIRERIAGTVGNKERAAVRTAEVALTLADIDKGTRITRGDLIIEFDAAPAFIFDKRGNVVGIDALVRVFRGAVELKVDPHRVCVNPPTCVPDGTTHTAIDEFGVEYEVNNFREDPREAYLTWLEQSIRGVPNAGGFRTRGTVTTVFATAPGGAGSVNGNNIVYATARTTAFAAVSNHSVGQNTGYVCVESCVIFDTSAIDDSDTVSDVVLSLDGIVDASTTDAVFTAASSSYSGGPVGTGDWVSGDSLGALTTYATWDTSGYSAGYNAFTSAGAAFNSAINKLGDTAVMIYSNNHRDAVTPTTDERVTFTDADAAGTTTDPKLDITHAAGTAVKDIIGMGIIPFAR